jgi:hypothetical protein
VNYSIPVYKKELQKADIQFIKEHLNDVLDQQVIISQMSNGITYQDTENMDEYERVYILSKLIEMKKEEVEARQKAYDEMKNKNGL